MRALLYTLVLPLSRLCDQRRVVGLNVDWYETPGLALYAGASGRGVQVGIWLKRVRQ